MTRYTLSGCLSCPVWCFLVVEHLKSWLGMPASKSVNGCYTKFSIRRRNLLSRQILPIRKCNIIVFGKPLLLVYRLLSCLKVCSCGYRWTNKFTIQCSRWQSDIWQFPGKLANVLPELYLAGHNVLPKAEGLHKSHYKNVQKTARVDLVKSWIYSCVKHWSSYCFV